MSIDHDRREFWGFIERAPASIPFKAGDSDGYNIDLVCRAGKEIMKNKTLVEAISYCSTTLCRAF